MPLIKQKLMKKKITFSDKNLQMYKNVSVSANYNRRSITVIIDVSKWSDWVMWPFFNPDGGDIIKYISDKKNPWTVSYSNRRFSILYQGGQKNGDKAHLQFRLIDSFPVNTEK